MYDWVNKYVLQQNNDNKFYFTSKYIVTLLEQKISLIFLPQKFMVREDPSDEK